MERESQTKPGPAFPLIRYLVYCRFPLLFGLVALLLGPVCFGFPTLLRNLLILKPAEFGYLTAGALFLAWTVLMTLETVLEHAGDRFEAPPAPSADRLISALRRGWPLWTGILACCPVAWALLATWQDRVQLAEQGGSLPESSSDFLLSVALAIAAGALVAHVLYAIAGFVQRLVSPGDVSKSDLMFASAGRWEFFLGRLHEPFERLFLALVPKRLRAVSREMGHDQLAGYLELGRPAHGHVRNLMMWLVTVGVYLWGAFELAPEDSSRIPSVGFALVILVFWAWLLPGVAFFADRYRAPTSLLLILLFSSMTVGFSTDHYFEAQEGAGSLPTVREAFLAPKDQPSSASNPVVLVAASGGGIRSAVWTAQVLSGLSQEDSRFAPSLRLISAVSGGSVGSLYYVDHLHAGADPSDLGQVVDRAGEGSLFAAAWGLTYPDLARILLPPAAPETVDRGVALERVWDSRLLVPGASLAQWAVKVAAGTLPPLIMNSTVAELGEPLLLAPLDIPKRWRGGAASGHGRTLDCDPKVATAARLSATFPWLTPMSRPFGSCNGFRLHLADGGYYDNFGVTSALHWLEELVQPTVGQGVDPVVKKILQDRGVLLVLIRASADGIDGEPRHVEPQPGWITESVGPVTTLVKVQGTTQLSRNDWELRQFAELWSDQHDIRIETFLFGLEAPVSLSWQLSESELQQVERSWTDPGTAVAKERDRFLLCLGGMQSCQPEDTPLEQRYESSTKR